MKISGQPPEKQVGASPPSAAPAAAAAAATTKAGQSAAATAQSSATSAGVAVTVSTQARALEQVSAPDADVDMNKVEAVRSAIAQGSYTVNPEAIADKLLANAQEMFNRTQN